MATQKVNLNQVPMGQDINSLVLRHDGSMYHNNEEKNRLPANSLPQEGDIVVSGLVCWGATKLVLYIYSRSLLKR